MTGAIPFLRDGRNVDSQSFKKLYVVDAPTVGSALNSKFSKRTSRNLIKDRLGEQGWQTELLPIS
jgi:hypothetical protein